MRALVMARLERTAAQHHGGMNMSDLIKLTPIFHEKIWGGSKPYLVTTFQRVPSVSAGPSRPIPTATARLRRARMPVTRSRGCGPSTASSLATARARSSRCSLRFWTPRTTFRSRFIPTTSTPPSTRTAAWARPSAGMCWTASPVPRLSSASAPRTAPRQRR